VGTREILQFQMSQNLGGNVLVFPAIGVFSQTLAQGMLNAQLAGVEGVENNMTLSMRDAELVAVDGAPPVEEELPFPVPERANRAFEVSVLEKDSTNPEAAMSSVVRGRDFTLEDNGQPVI